MDKNTLTAKLNKLIPGAVLEARRFGRSNITSIWVEAQSVQKVATTLRSETELKLDWLENLSVVEFEKVFVVTYFLRSSSSGFNFVMRASIVPSSPNASVAFPSVRNIWPMAQVMEDEAEEMFGIIFKQEETKEDRLSSRRLPSGWKGFPLRKNYVFPTEFLGISHSRPFVRGSEKKKPE